MKHSNAGAYTNYLQLTNMNRIELSLISFLVMLKVIGIICFDAYTNHI